jgi:hypothetical protein
MSGSIKKPRIFPLGDMTKAQNDHKLGVLMDLLASSMGEAILATEAIVVATSPPREHHPRAKGSSEPMKTSRP